MPVPLPRSAVAYLWLVVASAAGLVTVVWWGHGAQAYLTPRDAGLLALLFGLALVAIQYPLSVRPGRKVTVSAVVFFASVLLLDVPALVVLIAGSHALGGVVRILRNPTGSGSRRRAFRGLAFNIAQIVLAYGLGGVVYGAVLPRGAAGGLDGIWNLWAVPAVAVTVYLVNTLLVAVMVALQKRQSVLGVWLRGRGFDAVQFAGMYATGLVAALTASHYPWALMVMVLPAAMIYLSLKRTVELAVQAEATVETMRELAEQREELAKRMAEAAALHELDRAKNELITTISHELRTPITVIHGYAQLLKARGGKMEAGRMEALAQAVYANSTQLQRLVQDLVDVGHVERGTFTLQVEPFDLAAALREVVAGAQAREGGERVVYQDEDSHGDGVYVLADRARVVQVASNLVENALKYAPEGSVLIRARHEGAAVRIEVEDEGPGVPLEEQQRVWEKFYRGAEVVRHNLQRGTGIGLAVVKALVDAQGGRVGLETGAQGGARFWFELPAAEAKVLAPRRPALRVA